MLRPALTSVAMTALLSSTAFAGGPDMSPPECMHCFKPFLGVYYSYLNIDSSRANRALTVLNGAAAVANLNVTGSFPDTFNGLGFMFGAKYGPYYGVALGITHYFQTSNNITVTNVANTAQTTNVAANTIADLFFAEARGYLPMAEGFDLIGAIGAAFLDNNTNFSGTLPSGGPSFSTSNFSQNRLAWRFGLGADYFFTPNWGIEGMFHYMPTSGNNALLQDFWTANIGFNYLFS